MERDSDIQRTDTDIASDAVRALRLHARTDGDIFGEARTALDKRLDIPETVHVHVAAGVATLTGTVRLPGEQRLAEDVVRRVKGVRQVLNHTTLARRINAMGLEPPEAG